MTRITELYPMRELEPSNASLDDIPELDRLFEERGYLFFRDVIDQNAEGPRTSDVDWKSSPSGCIFARPAQAAGILKWIEPRAPRLTS